MKYLRSIPKVVSADQYLCHGPEIAQLGRAGFRLFLADDSDHLDLVRCDCPWEPKPHYRPNVGSIGPWPRGTPGVPENEVTLEDFVDAFSRYDVSKRREAMHVVRDPDAKP